MGETLVSVLLPVLGGVCLFASVLLWIRAKRVIRAYLTAGTDYDPAVLQMVVENVHEGLIIQDVYGRIEWCNPAYSRISGYTAEEIKGRRPQEFILAPDGQLDPLEISQFRYDLKTLKTGSDELVLNRRKDGTLFWNQLTFAIVPGAREDDSKIIVIARDVTEQVERENALLEARHHLKRQAEEDALTGAANRSGLTAYLDEQLKGAVGDCGFLGVIHADLDHFKSINDSLGHDAGDAVLVHVAKTISNIIRPKGLVARIGGDEFVVVLPALESEDALVEAAKRILVGLNEAIDWKGRPLQAPASIGLAVGRRGDATAQDLIRRADVALYQAKRNGRNRLCLYTDAMGQAHDSWQETRRDLGLAFERDELFVVLQPQFSLRHNAISGFEALIRWQHPERGVLGPGHFLSVAEETGQMLGIDRVAMEKGLEALKLLRNQSNVPIKMSINVSEASLRDPAFPLDLLDNVLQRELKPEWVVLELLENTLLKPDDVTVPEALNELSKTGFQIAMDDFGTGYAGLYHLSRLTVDIVKIDRSMISEIDKSSTDQRIVKSMIDLAHNLGLQTVAEGVETETQIDLLKEMGCPVIQGYAYGVPMPLHEAAKLVQNGHGEETKAGQKKLAS
ncbi:diguanylate cyclase/phosphodiesterase with PAS/PAC sensor(s) [Roseibium hamelinense]|uniref:Diguanylate cyclase/phosphodiesterase with PAS/PAC sensor(S) n=1 Tax=Roseibium hamelinense TaxID=150831 RepID=A0A562SXN2_9HYPH|nr:GGDEF domain-containing phosphodiesterase [Roseibium hamelinense]MTI43599.1 phosphodiesterase [Roseibium hamelinense]TWI86115.1 diguanylate cyclase/phosphodiesterase with PAS/PAC sensor(s) [Roseibium hamelinense]